MSLAPSGSGRRLARNTLHGASGRVASLVIWFLLTPAILRALGMEAFGIWSLFFALTGNLAALDLGLAQGTLKFVSAAARRGAHDEAGAHASLAVGGYVLLGAVWGLGLLVAAEPIMTWFRIPDALRPGAEIALMTAPFVFVLAGVTNVCMAVAQGYGRFDIANRALLLAVAGQGVAMIAVLAQAPSLTGLILAVAIGWLAGALMGLDAVRRAEPRFRWEGPRAAAARWGDAWRFGGPMQLTNVLAALHLHVDKVLLGRWISVAAIAPYEIGSRVAVAAASIPQLLLVAVLPEASALHESRDWPRLRQLYLRSSRFLLTGAAIVTAGVLGSADRLIDAWIGPQVAGAVLALRMLTVSAAIALLTGVATSITRGMGRTDLEAWFAIVAVGVHLLLGLWLVPARGLEGALVAIVAGNLIGATVFFVLFSQAFKGISLRDLLSPLSVPVVAIVLGAWIGGGVGGWLPHGDGPAAWLWVAVATLAASGTALALCMGTGFFSWRELRHLLGGAAA